MKTFTRAYVLAFCLALISAQNSFAQNLPPVQFEFGNQSFASNVDAHTRTADILSGPVHNDTYYRWVQFQSIPTDEIRSDLQSRGISFMEYVPSNCYLLAIPSDVDIRTMHQNGVRSIQPMSLPTKIDTRIVNGNIPDYAEDGRSLALKVLVMPGVNIDFHENEFKTLGAYNLTRPNHDRFIFMSTTREDASRIADLPYVRYVELMDPKGEPESVEGRGIQRGNTIDNMLTTGGLSYDADGIKILVRDDGDVGPHIDFQGRLWNDPNNSSTGTHGDGVAGVWAACGNLDPTIVTSAPAADVYVIDYLSTFLDNTLTLHQDSGVVITNSSYSNGCNAGYTTTTVTVDEMAHDNPTLLHVFSAGNSNNSDCGYGAGNQWGNVTGGHKQGKNVIAVANLFRDGVLVGSSSRGPAHDGRIKPDLAGHGQGQMSTDPNNQYQSFGGTSAAAPSTAGNLAQLYDVYNDLTGNTAPAALIKACAMNSAQDYGNVGPDYKFGWGLIHAGRAYDILANNQYSSHTISNGGSNTHNIVVPGGVGQLRIMVYWNDPEASASANPALVNNIDMNVDDPGSTNHLPYLLDPTPNPVTLDLPAGNGVDNLNNVEQVAITSPAAGTYTVNVDGTSIPMGPQEYYLVYSFIPTGVEVTYPLGNEKLVPGVVERIHWDAFGNIGTFDVEYSTNNGASWTTIATGIAAEERGIDWTPPAVTSGDCLIRVTRGGENDVSDETFNIHDVPANLCVTDGTADTAVVFWDAVPGATSYDIYQLGAEKMEIIASTSLTTINIGGIAGGTTYWFSVAANTGTVAGQRAFAVSYEEGSSSACIGCSATYGIPFAQGFESGFGDFCNPSCDNFDWATNTGSTASTGTGPSGAFEGTTYAYTEASSPNFPAKVANLVSPCIDLSGCANANLQFHYHMLGAEMGTLNVQVSTDQGATWTLPLFSVSGDQGDVWNLAVVDLSAYCGQTIMYRFNGITGTDFTSDIAIDNILVDDGFICIAPSNVQMNSILETEATIIWDDVSADSYEIELVDISASGSQTGIPSATGITDTSYTFTGLTPLNQYEAYVRSRCSGDSSVFVGPISFTTIGCVSGLPWTENFDSYATCTTAGGPQVCDFGGGWTQVQSDGNDWRINSGTTPSTGTGPDGDNPSGTGNYAYVEASTTFGLISEMISPCVDLDLVSEAEIEFYYHMFGGDMGTLNLDISTNGGASWTNIWTQSGQVQSASSDPFNLAIVNLSAYSGEVQFRFQGIAGPDYESDIAIDDIMVRQASACPSISPVVISNIMDNAADLSWSDDPSHNTVDLELVDVTGAGSFTGIPSFTGITDEFFDLTGLDEGNDYAVYIRGHCGSDSSSWTGPYTFTTTCSTYPGNTFGTAIQILSFPYADTNRTDLSCVTNEYTGQGSPDIIYSFVASSDTVQISTCNAISDFDTYLYLLDSASNVIAFNDDALVGTCSFTLNGLNRFSIINANVNINSSYYIVVDGFNTNSSGNYALYVDNFSNCPPTLDIGGAPVAGTYSASGVITSDAIIQDPKQIIYSAGGGVELNQGFEVELNAEFDATLDGCP